VAVRDPQAAGGGIVTELSLPERIVHAAEQALEEAAATVHRGITGVYSVDGYPTDMATASAAAVIEVLASDMDEHGGEGHASLLRMLAVCVREVRPLEVT
jgi:hypothetical protein